MKKNKISTIIKTAIITAVISVLSLAPAFNQQYKYQVKSEILSNENAQLKQENTNLKNEIAKVKNTKNQTKAITIATALQ